MLACDGLYEVATTNEVGQAITKMDAKGESVENMGKPICSLYCYCALFKDNVSTMVDQVLSQ